jgi:hypothetical protein
MSLLVIAYPELSEPDLQRIQDFRSQNDLEYFRLVGPHFKLVFEVVGWDPPAYAREVSSRVDGIRQFGFTLRSAAFNRDVFRDKFQVSLIPDEGLSSFIRLHHLLYRGSLKNHRTLNVDYLPGLLVGSAREPEACLDMVEYWNQELFSIQGHICHLDVVSVNHHTVQTLERLHLPGGNR